MDAVIDIGTNSVRLLLAEKHGDRFKSIKTVQTITRLGQGVDASGVLSPEAINRTCDALLTYQEILGQYPVNKPIVTVTSAARDAENRDDFFRAVWDSVGWEVRMLTGDEEAKASFIGALKVLEWNDHPVTEEVIVIDIGGGSTEILRGRPDGTIIAGGTSQVGSVRMTEQCIGSHPVDATELNLMLGLITQRLTPLIQRCTAGMGKETTLIGAGGTITTAAALEQGLTHYNPERITGVRLTNSTVRKWLCCLSKMDLQTRAEVSGLCRGREDVIIAGLAILHVAMDLLESDLLVSDGNLLQGLLYLAAV